MKRLFLFFAFALVLSSCSIEERLQKMEAGVHLQILAIAQSQILAAENTKTLSPPLRMLPYGKIIGEEATVEELISLTHLWLSEVQADPNLDETERLVRLTAVGVVAAMTPQDKVRSILPNTISHQYEEDIYSLAALRYAFIRDYLFNGELDLLSISNKARVSHFAELFKALKFIRDLPYRDRLRIRVASLSLDQGVPSDELEALGEKARRKLTATLPEALQKDAEVVALLDSIK